jgi:acyl-CoA dehydrogenase
MIDFTLEPEVEALRDRVRAFVADVVIPAEPRDRSEHGLDDGLLAELQEGARAAGLFARAAERTAAARVGSDHP